MNPDTDFQMRRWLTSVMGCALLVACGGGGNGAAPGVDSTTASRGDGVAKVTFVYRAQVAADTAVQNAFPTCAASVGNTHIHLGWRDFARIIMVPNGDSEWTNTFNDVPTGARQNIRINDANNCDIDKNGATTTNVFANGVELTNVVPTPGLGSEPGLSFSVNESGRVTP